MNDDEKPTVDAYNAETGEHVVAGTIVEPDFSRTQRLYRRVTQAIVRNPEVVFVATVGVLIVLKLVDVF
ncbi:hypothetical protein [Halosolutus gelatinilyticus]|uniref:hypothetical protein n=1 Tax=Halosolutus gelatinilyticus TaxID=2931975 RepID=UPI001FF4C71C|nr:hypothetical protein [Halosolutus gelatinilyticus]